MAVEAGAKVGLIPSDEETRRYPAARAGRRWQPLAPDADAEYERVVEVDVSELEPMVSAPHTVDNVRPVGELAGTKIHQVFIGSCTNGRLADLAEAARILSGRTIHPEVRLIVVPASRRVFLEAIDAGYIRELVAAGATVLAPGCGPCVGVHEGILGDGEASLNTSNRNFQDGWAIRPGSSHFRHPRRWRRPRP